ncbi:MAG: hypothetical protein LW806_03050 [Planctomycetaceae bacterium]|nr:hypothetical protein [Planctomycetaceae bacterium]
MSEPEPATVRRTHGELACPACGYFRRGVGTADNCPECGARGFVGEIVVGGRPTTVAPVAQLRRRVRIAFIAVPALALLTIFLIPSLRGLRGSAGAWLLYTVLGWAVLGFAVVLVPRVRPLFRRWSTAELSPERVVWEIRPLGITVREGRESRFIRADRVRRIWSDVAASPREARVTIVLHDTPGAAAFETPEIRLRGDIAMQRATVEAIRALLEKPGNLG